MSLVPLLWPVQASVILERAREDLQLSKKEFGAALGYEHSEYSKALHGVRPLDLHRVTESAEDDAQRAVAAAWLKALDQRVEKDLVADLCGRVERLLTALGGHEPEARKAALRDDAKQEVA